MHISISPTKGATTFSPLSNAFNRTTKDGDVPVVNFLLGSQFNTKLGGETSTTSAGTIINDTASIVTGKLEIAGESSDGTDVEKILSNRSNDEPLRIELINNKGEKELYNFN